MDCKKRLESIENLDLKIDQVSLREKMKKFDDLDTYARTQIQTDIVNQGQLITNLDQKISTNSS